MPFDGSGARFAAAQEFLKTGRVGEQAFYSGLFVGGELRGQPYNHECGASTNCQPGYDCIGGTCVERPESLQVVTVCATSDQCAEGWNCISNTCTPPQGSGAGPGTVNGCGGELEGDDCCSSGEGGCQVAGCGSNCDGGGASDGQECCGDRCCRTDDQGNVLCECGECEEYLPCNDFCDSYYRSNGEYPAGCSANSKCDECEVCFAQVCQPGDCDEVPCWCGDCCKDCDSCKDTGVCEYDCANCIKTRTVTAPCCCGEYTFTFNRQACTDWTQEVLESEIAKACANVCETADGETCKDCQWKTDSRTICDPTGEAFPACEDNERLGGNITSDGKKCSICVSAEYWDCNCGVPQCNCTSDCGDCRECNEEGECVPAEGCSANIKTVWQVPTRELTARACDQETGTCAEELEIFTIEGYTVTSACGQAPHKIVQTQFWKDGACPDSFSTNVFEIQDVDSNPLGTISVVGLNGYGCYEGDSGKYIVPRIIETIENQCNEE